jgi:hypothetical protein
MIWRMENGRQEERPELWFELYKAAIMEDDPAALSFLLPNAQNAIRERMQELWNAGATEIAERQRLDAAFHYLEILRSITEK